MSSLSIVVITHTSRLRADFLGIWLCLDHLPLVSILSQQVWSLVHILSRVHFDFLINYVSQGTEY